MKFKSFFVVVSLSILMVSCAKEPTKVSVNGITVNPSSLSMVEDDTKQIAASVSPSNAGNQTVIWSSKDGTVASVNNGTVTALKPGSTTIIATSQEGGFTATCEVFVASKSWYNLIDDEIILIEGDEEKLIVLEVRNGVAQGVVDNESLVWSSSNSAVATVDKGYIKAIKEGSVTITAKTDYINGHCTVTVKKKTIPEPVDLGLSVKWAPYNLGATKEEESGNYYAWGEINLKNYYDDWTYKWMNGDCFTKYNVDPLWGEVDNKTILEPEDDVAHVKWGEKWRIPTIDEWKELRSNCDWTWITLNGTVGFKITSKANGNSIFLPAVGWRFSGQVYNNGISGYYKSSMLGKTNLVYDLSFSQHDINVGSANGTRQTGMPIRPVSEYNN